MLKYIIIFQQKCHGKVQFMKDLIADQREEIKILQIVVRKQMIGNFECEAHGRVAQICKGIK